MPAILNKFFNCPCRNPYIPAKTVHSVTVVSRYSTTVCPAFPISNRRKIRFFIVLSVTADPNHVNTSSLKNH